MCSCRGLMVPSSRKSASGLVRAPAPSSMVTVCFRLSTVKASVSVRFPPSSSARTLMRTLSQASPWMKSSPPRPSITSWPSPPRMMLPPVKPIRVSRSPSKPSGMSRTRSPSSSRSPSMRSMPAWVSSCPVVSSSRSISSRLPRSSPRRMSLCFQPDRPSVWSKRSRRMSSATLVKIGMRMSDSAATRLPLWIAQSKPSMPSLRMTLSPCTMMSSPDSASKSFSFSPASSTSWPMMVELKNSSEFSPASASKPSPPSIQSSPSLPIRKSISAPPRMKSSPSPANTSVPSTPTRNTSLPSPPISTSRPLALAMTSSPSSPLMKSPVSPESVMMSSPEPPMMKSTPAPPSMRSLPPPPQMASSPKSAMIVSSSSVPPITVCSPPTNRM